MERPGRAGWIAAGLIGLAAGVAAGGAPVPREAQDRYDRIVQSYLKNRWEDLKEALKAPPKDLSGMTRQQRDDLVYVRKAYAECRPPWWDQSKSSGKFAFRPVLWGKTFTVTFDPTDEPGFHMQTRSGKLELSITWDALELDSTDPPKDHTMTGHGTKQGDMADMSLWINLSTAALMASFSMETLSAVFSNEQDKATFQRYQLFHGQLAALYHSSPRARHAGMVIYFSGFMKKYGTGATAGTRRAIGSMFLADLLADPSRWPSIHLPSSLPPDNAEGALAEHCIGQIDRNWTLAEDRALRDAALAFYKANVGKQVLKTGKITLPNKLAAMLEPDKDGPFKTQRDAWVMKHFEAAKAQPGKAK